jgi:uncharacterized membrane protein YbaN (DUF454 family)
MRTVYLLLGWSFFGLGATGIVVPVLPTTPLMLLALWAFAKSSKRFHDWLYEHKVFGPPLQKWRSHHVIPARAKVMAVAAMILSLAYLGLFTEMPIWAKGGTAVIMLLGAGYILSKPSRLP